MRDIKFRAWDERHNEMVYSDKDDCFYINTKGVLFMYRIPMSESGLVEEYYKSYDAMQFTGLKDKNGVDIYEGDILKVNNAFIQVVSLEPKTTTSQGHGEGFFSVGLLIADGYGDTHEGELRVIGNIYENPELIEKD